MLFRSRIAPAELPTCIASAISVLTLLLALGWDGLFVSLSNDDLMNLYYGWSEPLYRLVAANLFPFTTVYRPAGSAFYVGIFAVAGHNPIYYRVAVYVVILLGCVALYRLVEKLDGRAMAAALAVIPLAFHGRFLPIYTDSAYIYDLLCGLFFVVTVLFYHEARRNDRALQPWDVLILYLLWAATINSKEMGLTLPVVLAAYEVVFYRPFSARRMAWPAIFFVLSVVAWRCKVAPGSHLFGNASYEAGLDIGQILYRTRQYTGDALLIPSGIVSSFWLAAIFVISMGITFAVRRKGALMGFLWMVITPWPILLVAGRPFSAMFVPWLGACLLAGSAGAEVLERLRTPQAMKPIAVGLAALCWSGLLWWGNQGRPPIKEASAQHEPVREAIAQYSQLPGLCESNRVLIINSRFDEHYQPYFIVQTICRRLDMTILIPGASILRKDVQAAMGSFDFIAWDHGDSITRATRNEALSWDPTATLDAPGSP